jgi:hypothetical protein
VAVGVLGVARDDVSPAAVPVRRIGDRHTHDQEVEMQYALLVYTREGMLDGLSESERQDNYQEYVAVAELPGLLATAQLEPVETATTVRVSDGRTLTTDGPFADTKEVFAGYYVFEAENLDQAVAIAERIPAARQGGAVEVRPVVMQR